jgi:hypothetical protein
MPTTGVFGEQCISGHSIFITDRGGKRRIAELLDVTQVRWTRVRDDISEGDVILRGAACSAQAETLALIEPKRHELVIYRGEERVWEGPVMRVGWHSDWVEIYAHDVMEYVFGTPLTRAYDNRHRVDYDQDGNPVTVHTQPTEVTTRLEGILTHEMLAWESLNPPANVLPHLAVHHYPNEVRTSAHTTPYQMTVGEHMDNFARYGGIDYTVVGRAIHIWDVNRWLGDTRLMTEADIYSEVIITAYGADLATRAVCVSDDGRYGIADSNADYYGPWTKIFTIESEDQDDAPTDAELKSQAQRNLTGRNPVPVEVRIPDNSGIRLGPGLSIDMLVPGVRVPLLATLNARQLSQVQKIHTVGVQEDPEGESVSMTLVPAHRVDSDDTTASDFGPVEPHDPIDVSVLLDNP